MERLLSWLENIGYNRRSVVAGGLLGAVCLAVAVNWRHLVAWDLGIDWLLTGIWAFMGALLLWRVRPVADLKLVFVAVCGGFLIEWWGTETLLWTYFTRERPPLWIIPAWPIAALTIDRLNHLVTRFAPWIESKLWPLYWIVVPVFIVVMADFFWPTVELTSSRVVLVLMVFVTVWKPRTGRDLALFITGATLGILLEYWGTSRRCWVYYTREVPPYQAILAHGFASIAFARGVQGVDWVLGLMGRGARREDAREAVR